MTKKKTSHTPVSLGLTRRQVLAAGAAGGALAAFGPFIRTSRAAKGHVVYATWGGSWAEAAKKGWFDPFTKKTGIEVKTVNGPDYGKIRAMVKAGNTEWDVAEVNPDFIWIGEREGLLEKLDFNVVKVNPKTPKDLYNEYSAPQLYWSRTMVYNTKKYSKDNHPRTWAEFWDLKKFPGKRSLYAKANGGTLELALMADGVPGDKLYPLDVERAFKSLDKIKDHVIWYETNAQSVQHMMDESAVLASMADGRALAAIDTGAPIAIEYNQSQMTWTDCIVPKGAPNKANAMELVNYIVSDEGQAQIAMEYTYGPTNPDAFKKLPPDRAKMLSGGPEQQGKYVLMNEKWWGENRDRVAELFNAWRLT